MPSSGRDALPRSRFNPLRLGHSLARVYFAVQSLAGIAWWVSVFTLPPMRSATLGSLHAATVAALDIPLFVCASLLVAVGARWAVWVVVPWTTLVAAAMVVFAALTGEAGWGAVIMVAAAGGSILAGALAWQRSSETFSVRRLMVGPFAFHTAPRQRAARNVWQSIMQMTVFWGLLLGVIPLAIAWFESRADLSVTTMEPLLLAARWLGVLMLVIASGLGVWSAITMAIIGHGTPLPSAMPNELVTAGPYRFVRNPMAVSGIAQGIAVGLILGSWLVVLYALAGSLVWNWLIRPHEEADLEQRFGKSFIAYRERVSCWVPRKTSCDPLHK